MDRATKLSLIAEHAAKAADRKLLSSHCEHLVPCAWLVLMEGEDHPALNDHHAGWLGGRPSLPAKIAWPALQDAPLPYLMGLDLAALPAWLGLPTSGDLCLFGASSAAVALGFPAGARRAPKRPPQVPYCNGHLAAGEVFDRQGLEVVPGLRLDRSCVTDRALAEKLAQAVRAMAPAGTCVGRIGGADPDGARVGFMQECAYRRAHGHPGFIDGSLTLATLDAHLAALRQRPPPEPEPVLVPPVVAARISTEAAREIAVGAAILADCKEKPPHIPAFLTNLKDAVKALRIALNATNPHPQVHAYGMVLRALNLWHRTLAEMPAKYRQVIARHRAAPVPATDAQATRIAEELASLLDRIGNAADSAAARAAISDAERHVQAHGDRLPLVALENLHHARIRVINRIHFARQGQGQVGGDPATAIATLTAQRASLAWLKADPAGHRAAAARWCPLLSVFSEGPFMWSDCGQLIYLVDTEDLARGDLTRMQGVVDSG